MFSELTRDEAYELYRKLGGAMVACQYRNLCSMAHEVRMLRIEICATGVFD